MQPRVATQIARYKKRRSGDEALVRPPREEERARESRQLHEIAFPAKPTPSLRIGASRRQGRCRVQRKQRFQQANAADAMRSNSLVLVAMIWTSRPISLLPHRVRQMSTIIDSVASPIGTREDIMIDRLLRFRDAFSVVGLIFVRHVELIFILVLVGRRSIFQTTTGYRRGCHRSGSSRQCRCFPSHCRSLSSATGRSVASAPDCRFRPSQECRR